MVPAEVRQRYAEEIRAAGKIRSLALIDAFARVPREEFAGPFPWRILSLAPGQMKPQVTEVTNATELYWDVAILLDPSKNLTNGNPGTLAPWLDSLELSEGKSVFHMGCATGYYTAVMAEVVGSRGQVTAVEIEPALAEQARVNLARYPNVEVIEGDGGVLDTGARDAILINAGVTHPTENWLRNLSIGGKLTLPITMEFGIPHLGKGMVLQISRLEAGYSARFFPIPVMIYSCSSVRDGQVASAIGAAFRSGGADSVRSLRRDAHSPEPTCWLHSNSFCLSTRESS